MSIKVKLQRLLEYVTPIWAIGLSVLFVLSIVLYFTDNFLVFEPLYNLLILIALLLAMIFYAFSKACDVTNWKRGFLLAVTVLDFFEIIFFFISLVALAGD